VTCCTPSRNSCRPNGSKSEFAICAFLLPGSVLPETALLLDPADRALFLRIWKLTWPLVLSNALEMTVGLVDLLLVRPFGPSATAAIGVSRQVTFVVEAAAGAIATGVLTLVSQGIGAGFARQVQAVVRQSFRLVLLFGLPTTLAGYLLSRQLLVGLQVSAETLAWGEPYLHVYFVGLVFLWGNLVGAAVYRGAGDVWTPLKLTLGVNLLNVGLNYLFIYGAGPLPAFEVMGAALGTVIARACGALVYLIILWRPSVGQVANLPNHPEASWQLAPRWLDMKLIGRILRIGVPMALANVLRHGSRLVFLAIVGASALGVSLQAAVGLGMQMRLLGVLVALAFQTALATLVGQAIGRGDRSQAELIGLRGLQILGLLMLFLTGTIVVLAEPLAQLFIQSFEAARLGAQVLRWFAVAQMFSALSIGMQGALLGAGDTAPALRYTLLSEWGVMLPLGYLLLETQWWFPESLLAAWLLAPAITLVFMYRRWRGGHWKTIRV
jgi:putative MATE family efflux protein